MRKHNLPSAEMEVLACLHRLGGGTAAQVRESLASLRPMAHGSVVTLLKRLESKKLVTRRKAPAGKAFIYSPRQERQQTFGRLIRELVQRIFHGDGTALVASLFESKPPTTDELEKIQEMLDELRRQRNL